jgi:allophanate hydrolase subunit 2
MMPTMYQPDYKNKAVIHLLACYQYDIFTVQQKKVFFGQDYQIDPASDRIGYRLKGQAIEHVPEQMLSEGISNGSVEITHAGLPIILLKDRPTIGGYPKIGCVFSLDISKLVQRQATSKVCFELISLQDAQKRRREFNAFFGIQ